MTLEELVAQARANRPGGPPPSLAGVDRGLRKLLRTLLSAFDYDAMVESGPGLVCRTLAALLAEIEDLQQRH
jgi:hypothetical protein